LAPLWRYRHGSLVDQLAETWLRFGAIDTTDSELRFLLAARFAVTHDFLTELTFVKGGEWTTLFLSSWRQACRDEHKFFVSQIAQLFAIGV
jgi:hypothetical protein